MPHFGEFKLQDIPILHILHYTLAPGATDVSLCVIHAGMLDYNTHFTAMHVSVDPAPGVGKTVSVTLTDGTDSITVSLTGAETCKKTTGRIDLDVATETLTLQYSQTAGGASNKATITMRRWYS